MGERRYARPVPSRPITSVEERLAGVLAPQYSQTGVGAGSTDTFMFTNLIVTGTATINTATVTSLTVGTSSLKAMAFQPSTGVTITGGSINATPIGGTTPSTGKFTELVANSSAQVNSLLVSSAIAFGSFVSDLAVVLTGFIQIKTSTGGTVNLAVVSS